MNEEKIIVQAEENEVVVDVENIELNVEQQETVEYIEVAEPETISIEIGESFGWTGGDASNHNSLYGRGEPDQHPIEAITGLQSILDKLSAIKDTVYATNGGLAEFRQWLPDGVYDKGDIYQGTGGVGYFVSLVTATGNLNGNNTYIDICKKTNNDGTTEVSDVYGVTVANSGFCGYYGDTNNPNYAKVCLLGDVEVRVSAEDYNGDNDNRIDVGDYVIPNQYGRASKSDNGVGFKVISKGSKRTAESDTTAWYYVRIALVPQNDNISRIVKKIEDTKTSLDNVIIQLGDKIGELENSNIQLGEGFKGLEDLVNESTNQVNTLLPDMVNQLQEAVDDVVAEANTTINKMTLEYTEAVSKANEANEAIYGENGVLKDIKDLQDNIQPLATWAGLYECVLQNDVSQGTQCYFNINDITYGFTMPISAFKNDKVRYDTNVNTATIGDQTVVVAKVTDVTDLTLIEPFKPMGNQSMAGFLARAEKDHTELSSLTSAFGDNGSNLTAIIQKIDENGAAIQHLVTHVDKYILGKQSPAYGLTLEQTSFIQPGTIYVPTQEDIEETYIYKDGEEEKSVECKFDYGTSYIWAVAENEPYTYMWKEDKDVHLVAPFTIKDGKIEPTEPLQNEDLWYCWQGVLNGDKYLYDPGVLYCWNEKRAIWIPVASIDNSNAMSIGSVNQTAKTFQIAYTDLKDNMASLKVEVDRISSTVENEVKEQISSIHQTAEKIMMGVYDANDGNSTSLGLLLDGMTSTAIDVTPVRIKTVLTENSLDMDKYSSAPTWNGEEFVFAEPSEDDGKYCFEEKDSPHTYYCKIITGGYEVYGINNIAMANLSTRVTNTESEVESWTRFQKGQNETLTSINQTSDEAGAAISSMVYGDFRECVEIKLELTEDDKADFAESKYSKQPIWNRTTGRFEFDTTATDNGEYCLPTEDLIYYYKLLYRDGEVIGYEKYQMKSSPYAAVVQKVDDNGNSYVGLVAGNDDDMGSMIVESINNRSTATINADRVAINGTTTFSSLFTPGKTTIDGSKITTGTVVVKADDVILNSDDKIIEWDGITGEEYELDGKKYYRISEDVLSEEKILNGTIITSDNEEIRINSSQPIVIENASPIEWDGKTEGVPYFNFFNMYHLYKVTDITFQRNELVGGKVVFSSGEEAILTEDCFHTSTRYDTKHLIIEIIFNKMIDNVNMDIPYYIFIEYDGDNTSNRPKGIYCDSYVYQDIHLKLKQLSVAPDQLIKYSNGDDCYIFTSLNSANCLDGTYFEESVRKLTLPTFSNLLVKDTDNTTVINGGMIQTGSIEADKISADSLKANGYEPPNTETTPPEIYARKGTFFDLANGTITSTNFVLDQVGNVSLRGRISATTGDIGGFSIEDNSIQSVKYDQDDEGNKVIARQVYVGTDKIILGDDAFYVTDTGYLFANNAKIIGEINANTGKIGGFDISGKSIHCITYTNDNQTTIASKVYIGTDKIALGANDNFQVDNFGNLTTSGDVTLGGNITLSGNITWSANSNPVKVLYYRELSTGSPSQPTSGYNSHSNSDTSSSKAWHKTFNSNYDVWASYSYSGGTAGSWGTPVRIVGKDGDLSGETIASKLSNLNSGLYYENEKLYIKGDCIQASDSLFVGSQSGGYLTGYVGSTEKVQDTDYYIILENKDLATDSLTNGICLTRPYSTINNYTSGRPIIAISDGGVKMSWTHKIEGNMVYPTTNYYAYKDIATVYVDKSGNVGIECTGNLKINGYTVTFQKV